jgi:glycosyltransferase involved in cell wall biosynthesis
MTQRPLISCVVPVYNGERYLREALDSILAQTYQPLEVIVVDDGSTDRTPELIASYAGRVRPFRQPHAGASAARNLGLRQARSEFVAFLDADDLWHRQKLARQMDRFEARPELDLCVTGGQNFWMPELSETDERARDPRQTQPWPGYVSTATLLARRRAFDLVGSFDTSLEQGEDRDWFIRAAELGLVKELLPEVLLRRRMHGANSSDRLTHAATGRANLELVKALLERQRRRQW